MSDKTLIETVRDCSREVTPADRHGLLKLIEKKDSRIAELEAARIAYASEFPLNADGEPGVGNIHANIRKLKSDAAYWKARAKDAEEYIDEEGK